MVRCCEWITPLSRCLVVALVMLGVAGTSLGQTATTGTIVGIVTDPTGAVVPGAEVNLKNLATNLSHTTKTTEAGQFTFPNVPPGQYQITVRASGFRTAVLTVKVEVASSTLADIALTVGEVTDVVEVTPIAGPELQTVDSAVGKVLVERDFLRLPTTQRSALELISLQVTTLPPTPTGATRAGGIAGAQGDQNSYLLDGIQVTEIPRGLTPRVSFPVELIAEWRGTVSNPNASMGRSSGGQFSFTTRSGGNEFHGAAYWYHQNDNLNANSWTRNRLGQKNPELKDNRFGFRMGGPIVKDKTFFFAFYEGRRFPRSVDAVRVGISESLRQGILRFRDAAGNIVSYDLRTSTLCGPTGNQPCDPRGLGLNPLISTYFSLYPRANDPSSGDGLNTIGIRAPVNATIRSDFAFLRLDHNFTDKWRLNASYLFELERSFDATQVDFNPKNTGGALMRSTSGQPRDPDAVTLGLVGQITPTLINDFRFGWNKQDINFTRVLPQKLVPPAGLPLDLAGTVVDDPGDPAPTFRPRPVWTDTRIWSFADNLTWVKKSHTVQSGVNFQRYWSRHARYDRGAVHVVPIAVIGATQFRTIPPANRPPTCSPQRQTNCLVAGQEGLWNNLYAALLGMWDNTTSVHLRDSQGNPIGIAPSETTSIWQHWEFFGSDIWRLKPSLTLNYGLNLLVETPQREANDQQFFLIDRQSGDPIRPHQLLEERAAAAAEGKIISRTFAYVPRRTLDRSLYPRIVEAGPRAALAWNPSFKSGVLGALFGDRQTVFRGGYSLLFNQISTVQTGIATELANQLRGTSFSVQAPECNAAGSPGPGCAAGVPFRIGVDGAAFTPAPGPLAIPFVPGSRDVRARTPFGVVSGFALDPDYTVGRIHGGNLTLQRQLPGQILVEAGWIGRWGRKLPATINVNAMPWNLKDLGGRSNQTFAQAFDAVASELRRGVAPTAVTPQPWFENSLGAGGTQRVAAQGASAFVSANVGALVINVIDPLLQTAGAPTILNQQFGSLAYFTNGSLSNYNAFFLSLTKRASRGLSFVVNWTWSHCFDQFGTLEDTGGAQRTDPFNPDFDYGDCLIDRRHVVQSYGVYELPLPQTNKLLGGWYTSWIFTASTGAPFFIDAHEIAPGPHRTGLHRGVAGSGGVGTAGDPARRGTGLNLFADPEAVFKNLRFVLISQDGRRANRGAFRNLGAWNLDFSLGKRTGLTERLTSVFAFDFFNIFNHVNFTANPFATSLGTPTTFGVITDPINAPRALQFSFRLEF